MADYAKDVLVETDWVEAHLDDDAIRIVEVGENPALYAEAHIPGAVGFDWQEDLQEKVKRSFLGPKEFGELFGSRGIANDHTIVLYGDRNNWFAAYTYLCAMTARSSPPTSLASSTPRRAFWMGAM